jgi:threonine dehydrogenase-like Zn-dependent dehydrogenase
LRNISIKSKAKSRYCSHRRFVWEIEFNKKLVWNYRLIRWACTLSSGVMTKKAADVKKGRKQFYACNELPGTTGWLGADVVIDAVGAEATGRVMQTLLGKTLHMVGGAATALHWAINSVKKGGIVSIVGVYGPIDALVPIGNVVNKGLTIRANQASVKRLLPRLIEHVQNGILDPKALITHRIPLEEVSDAYQMFSAKLDNCIKPVLIPPSAGR